MWGPRSTPRCSRAVYVFLVSVKVSSHRACVCHLDYYVETISAGARHDGTAAAHWIRSTAQARRGAATPHAGDATLRPEPPRAAGAARTRPPYAPHGARRHGRRDRTCWCGGVGDAVADTAVRSLWPRVSRHSRPHFLCIELRRIRSTRRVVLDHTTHRDCPARPSNGSERWHQSIGASDASSIVRDSRRGGSVGSESFCWTRRGSIECRKEVTSMASRKAHTSGESATAGDASSAFR